MAPPHPTPPPPTHHPPPSVALAPKPPSPVLPSQLMGCYWDKGYPAASHDKSKRGPCDLPVVMCGGCPDGVHVKCPAGKTTLESCQASCKGHRYFAVQVI
jgi:hypothetical protein